MSLVDFLQLFLDLYEALMAFIEALKEFFQF